MRFSPGIYEHAAALIGQTPWAVSRDGQLLAEAHRTAWETYRHPLVVVGIDVYNLEAEAYGAGIRPPTGNNIPSITSHPCAELEDLLNLPPLNPSSAPRIREILKAGQLLQSACPGAEVRIPVCGPFALAIGLLGMDELLMSLIEERDTLIEALHHLLTGQGNYLAAIAEAGLRPLFFESGTTPPLLPVADFEAVEAPLLHALFSEARDRFAELPACIIGGDAAPIAHALMETGPGFVIAPSETNQARFVETARAYPDVHVRVNIPAAVLLDRHAAKIDAVCGKAVDIASTRPNCSIGCGVVPFETDPQAVLHVRNLIEQSNR